MCICVAVEAEEDGAADSDDGSTGGGGRDRKKTVAPLKIKINKKKKKRRGSDVRFTSHLSIEMMYFWCETYRKISNTIRTIFTKNRGPEAGVRIIHLN